MDRRFVAVAEIAKPHGIRGELSLKLYNEGSDLLLRRPVAKLRLKDGVERDIVIDTARAANKAILVTLHGVADRNTAEELRGAKLLVPRDAFPPAAEGEFYACDLEGARVVLPGGEAVGTVTTILSYPTCDVLVIDRGGQRLEVPLVDAYIASVDVENALVELVTLEGIG